MKKVIVTLLTLALLAGSAVSAFAWTPKNCLSGNCPNAVEGVCTGDCIYGGEGPRDGSGMKRGGGNGGIGGAGQGGSQRTVLEDGTVLCPNADCPNAVDGVCTGACIYDGEGPKDGTGLKKGGNGMGNGACANPGSGVQSGGRGKGRG